LKSKGLSSKSVKDFGLWVELEEKEGLLEILRNKDL
jgi:hypothetical protein